MSGFYREGVLEGPDLQGPKVGDGTSATARIRRRSYDLSKRIFDIAVCTAAIPVFVCLCVVLLVANRFGNRGPLFYLQKRKGKGFSDFIMIKFRTMLPRGETSRGAFDPLETSRITPLGQWMRRTRLDEVPQILNVLLGHMSLIGPRPEIAAFADTYLNEIENYEFRGSVRPGISGYAQVKLGYVDSKDMIIRKTELDVFYIRNMSWRLDLQVLMSTVGLVFTTHGAR